MGILDGTRVNFWGGIQADVCVANNTNSPGGTEVLDLVKSTVDENLTDEEVIAWLRYPGAVIGDPVEPYYMEGGWNYYGDHITNYKNATVSSEGPAGAMVTTGGLAGQGVYLLGSIDPNSQQGPFFGPVMVDLDPTSSQTTQIFVGGLLIGSMEDQKLLIRHDTVCSSQSLALRILNGEQDAPGSSVGNGTFQVTFPLNSIVNYDKTCQSLVDIIENPKATGIVLRFSMFEMAPYMTTPELVEDYGANKNSSNPSSGHVIGTIGPAYESEPDTCPPGRLLVNEVGGAEGFAKVNDDFLSIDTVSLLLKEKFRQNRKGYTDPIEPNIKFDSLEVKAGEHTIGSFDPLSETYYLYGGIADVPINMTQSEQLAANPIQITGNQAENSVLIEETALRIYSNDRNIYLDDIVDEPVRTCIVSYLGGPLTSDTIFNITSSTSGQIANPKYLSFPDTVSATEGSSSISYSVTDNGESAGFEALTIRAGVSDYFVNFRKFPTSDFGIKSGSTITWAQVYQHVLRFYHVVFPAMSKRIALNFEGSIKDNGEQILARTSAEYWNTTLYMPIVRSMTPSQYKLLKAYLQGETWNP